LEQARHAIDQPGIERSNSGYQRARMPFVRCVPYARDSSVSNRNGRAGSASRGFVTSSSRLLNRYVRRAS
jgi:hypothetical protein